MPEFYKYANRNVDSQVNWALIGQNLSDTLEAESKFREDKKAAIDKATFEFGNTLANAPTGESTTLNQWMFNGVNDIQQARLLQDKMLKSGKLSLRDYNTMRQNLTSNSDTLFGLAKEYNAEYHNIMERAKSQDPKTASQALEMFLAGSGEGFANFTNSKIFVNPNDHTISIGTLLPPDKDGVRKMGTGQGSFMTVNELRNRLKTKYNKYDDLTVLSPYVDKIGTVVQNIIHKGSATKSGFIDMVTDPTKREAIRGEYDAYKEYEDGIVKQQLSLPFNVTSILTDYQSIDPSNNNPYKFTFDENEAKGGSNYILLKKDGLGGIKPEFTKEQTDVASDYLRKRFRTMLEQKHQIKEYNEPIPPQYIVNKAIDDKTKEAEIAKTKAETNKINAKANAGTNTKGGGGLSKEQYDNFAKDVTNLITDKVVSDEDYAEEELNSSLSGLGYTIENPGLADYNPFGSHYIKITRNKGADGKEGEDVSVTIQLKKPDSKQKIINFLLENPPKDYKYDFSSTVPAQEDSQNTDESNLTLAEKMRREAAKKKK